MPLEPLLGDLACPRCRGRLSEEASGLSCGTCRHSYRMARGQPVLVDFEQSILIEQEVEAGSGASTIRRRTGTGSARARVARNLLPRNRAAPGNARRFADLVTALARRPRVLIVGGASQGEGTALLLSDPSIDVVAFDLYASELTQFIADAHQIPLADESVDGVWIQAVLEHVLDPWRVAGEIHRVLRAGGIVYAETPFLQQVHEGAYDFTRFTESGHRWLFRRFELVDSGVVLGPASQLLWSIEHVVRGLTRSVRAGVAAKMMLFWLRWLDRLIPRAFASDAASAVYFLGRKAGPETRPRDIIAFYKGAHRRRDQGNSSA